MIINLITKFFPFNHRHHNHRHGDTINQASPILKHQEQVQEQSKKAKATETHDYWSSSSIDDKKSSSEKEEEAKEEVVRGIEIITWKECVLIFIAYLFSGTLGFSYLFDQWRIVDSLYFSVVTFTTVSVHMCVYVCACVCGHK